MWNNPLYRTVASSTHVIAVSLRAWDVLVSEIAGGNVNIVGRVRGVHEVELILVKLCWSRD